MSNTAVQQRLKEIAQAQINQGGSFGRTQVHHTDRFYANHPHYIIPPVPVKHKRDNSNTQDFYTEEQGRQSSALINAGRGDQYLNYLNKYVNSRVESAIRRKDSGYNPHHNNIVTGLQTRRYGPANIPNAAFAQAQQEVAQLLAEKTAADGLYDGGALVGGRKRGYKQKELTAYQRFIKDNFDAAVTEYNDMANRGELNTAYQQALNDALARGKKAPSVSQFLTRFTLKQLAAQWKYQRSLV